LQEHRQFICVTCPVGCTLDATLEEGQLSEVQGQACRRGKAFVEEELTAPRRMLTTTVRVRGGRLPLVPVRSRTPLPKEILLQVASELRSVVLEAPVREHQVVLPDTLHSGVDIITSREVRSIE
jgi:CxxC motif-containing protein